MNPPRFIALCFGALVLASCTSWRDARAVLSDVETYVQNSPDSALLALESIPRPLHRLPFIRGPYALLYTRAQERAGILVTEDTLIRNAVTYYRLFGSSSHRFQARYYLGRVYQNAGNRGAAMDAYVKAESILPAKVEPYLLYNLHADKCNIYAETFDFDRALEETFKAIGYARSAKMSHSEFRCYLNIVSLLYNIEKDTTEREGQYLDSAKMNLGKASWKGRMDYYAKRASYMVRTKYPAVEIEQLLDSVIAACQDSSYGCWDWWADTYNQIGRPQKALSSIERLPSKSRTALSYSILSEVYDSLGQAGKSLEAYRRYVDISDSLDLVLFRQDTRFIEERHASQMRVRRFTDYMIGGFFAFMALVAVAVTYVRRKRKKEAKMQTMFEDLKEEYESLQQMSQGIDEVSERAKDLLGVRMRALGAFLTEEQPQSLDKVANRLETLTENRKELVETMCLLFGVYHPRFVSMLLDYGLNTIEIGFCCLYVLGFRTTEIGDVINRSGYYNISSDIRRKLPVEHVRLSTWLNERFQQLS